MQQRLTGLLLRPSPFSIGMSLLFAIGVLAIANWSHLLETLFFYDYFFGTDGLVTQLENGEDGGNFIADAFFGSSITNNVIILLAALGIGGAVYGTLQLFSRFSNNSAMLREIHVVEGVSKTAMRWELRQRLKARGIVLVGWLIYLQISLHVILPFCMLASQVGIKALWGWQGWAYSIFAVGLFLAGLHIHVIFMRLFALRPRVFGGEEAILAEELGRQQRY